MYQFNFSISKTVTKNTTSYPISLSDVKSVSQFYIANPTDTSIDAYATAIIPKIVNDWEKSTNYLLLDQAIQSFVPNLETIFTDQINIGFPHLNIREFTNIKYHKPDWNYSDSKSIIDNSNYFIIAEINDCPAKLNIKSPYLPLNLFPIINNLEANYKAGFANNDFTNLDKTIKDALIYQVAMVVDALKGFCEDFYSTMIKEAYAQYSITKQVASII